MSSQRFDHPPDPNRKPFRRLVLILCFIALAVVCVRASVQRRSRQGASPRSAPGAVRAADVAKLPAPSEDPEDQEGVWPRNSVYRTYYLAGMRWRVGRSLYRSLEDLPPEVRQAKLAKQRAAAGSEDQARNSGEWGGFRYSPTAALMFVPLTWMSVPVGEVVWRVFLACVTFGGLYWCCRVGLPRPLARRDWATFFLLVLPSVTGCLNNGQSSCLVLGCMLGAIAAVTVDLWTIAAVLVVIPTLLKLYPVSLGLLLSVTYPRRFSWRFLLILVAGLALPFLIRPHTMPQEYTRWLSHLVNDAKHPTDILHWDQDLRLLLMRAFHLKLSDRAFLAVQAAAAAFIAGLCLAGRWAGWPRRILLARMLGLACCWMTVLGMATEPSTYILIAPALAWSMWEVWLRPAARSASRPARGLPGGTADRVVLVCSYVLLLSVYVMFWFPKGKIAASYGPEPLAGLLLFGYLLVRSVRELRAGKPREPVTAPVPVAAGG